NDCRLAVVEYEEQMQKIVQENQMIKKEQMTTKELLRRCQLDLQAREETLNQNHKRMQQLQSHCEQLTAENVAIRTTNEQLQSEIENLSKAKEEIAALKHSINALKGTVTAKTAEAKAFQAYGSSAREHLQTQGILLQQHAAFETRTFQVTSVAMSSISGFRQLVDEAKDIFVNWKSEMLYMFDLLSKKLHQSAEYVQMAFAEHKLLRHALTSSSDLHIHLHDQVWQVHRNALMVCQIINEADSAVQRRLTANYLTGELMYRPEKGEEEILHLQFDHIFSNRAKEWSSGESILPTIKSVLHGYNACIITFQGQPDIERSVPDPAAPALSRLVGQNATAIIFEHLFEQCKALYGFATTHCSLSYLGVYSEIVHDLLAVDAAPVSESIVSNNPTIVLDTRNAQEAGIAVEEGTINFEKICSRCPTMEYLTHKIITICVTVAHNFDGTVMKSKLQLVELASGIDSTIETTWQDTERIRATISAENSLHAFTSCLSEIRLQDASFVRYHGSKLTLLLQDCINLHAKALIISTIRTNIDERSIRNLHMLQLIREALHPPPEIANEELSLDMFLNRAPDVYRYQIRWQPAPRSALQPIVTSWETELEAMKLRNKIILETSEEPKLSLESPGEATKTIKKSMGVADVVVAGGARMLGLSFLQKGGTFIMNILTLRRLPVHLSGVSLSLELVLSTTFVVREGLRLASLREENLSEAISVRKLLNTAWICAGIGLLCTILAAFYMAPRLYSTSADDYTEFQYTLALFCFSAAIEYVTEPLYILANASLNFPLRVKAQGWGFFVKAIVQVVLVVVFDMGMLAFGYSQVAFALVHGLIYLSFYMNQIAGKDFPLNSAVELLPSPSVPINKPVVTLWWTLLLQSSLKYLLTEGDKLILSAFESYKTMGAYSVAFNIGSLAPRLLFLPIEDACKAMFIFVCFGSNYARTALFLLAGYDKAIGETPVVLQYYFIYVYFLALNGICESFVHAVGDKAALQRLNSYLIVCFVLTTLSAVGLLHYAELGIRGIVIANCINMSLRIAYCLHYMADYFDFTMIAMYKSTLPPFPVSIAFGVAAVLTFLSESRFQGPLFKLHILHISFGGILFVLVLLIIWRKDSAFVQSIVRLRQSKDKTN
ncbi:hypothetical protein THRCLA_08415, partial [Thraustotheca clavata]